MELPKECCFQFAVTMIVGLVVLEDFVQALKEEGPKPLKRSIIPNAVCGITGIVVVGFDLVSAVQLDNISLALE